MDINYPEAIYNEQPLVDYMDNPMIEALPPIMSFGEVARVMSVIPPFREEERELSPELRFHCLQRIFHFFQPFEPHLVLERKVSAIIRQGYITRNPLDKEHVKYMNESYKELMEGKIPEIDKVDLSKTAQGFTMIGIAGGGKSTGLERVLNTYPKVIVHKGYKGKSLCITQIPWIKLQCPYDGSTKGLCNKFLIRLDEMLGTKYFARYNYKSQDTLLPLMGHIARLHNIGVLVIDEIQHLSVQKSGGVEKMLNFFVTLVNSIGIPVILIGTNKSFSILGGEFRQALRGTGQGSTTWKRMDKSKNWDLLMKGLFRYQWTKIPVEPSEELKDLLYDESQGIIDLAKKVFYLSQMEAIFTHSEKITVELIKSTAKDYLELVRPMLNALKSGDIEKIRKYEDLKPPDFVEYVDNLKEKLMVENFIKYEMERSREAEQELQNMLVTKLSEKIRDSKIIQESVRSVLGKVNPTEYDFNDLYEQSLEIAEKRVTKKLGVSKRKKEKTKFPEGDLRGLLKQAIEMQQSIYEFFLESGVIKEPYNVAEQQLGVDNNQEKVG